MMNTDSVGQGSHWILGIVAFGDKMLILFDSLVYVTEDVRIAQFKQLAALAMCSSLIAGVDFNVNLWSCIFSADCPKQRNSYDCGMYATTTAVCILNSKDYVNLDSEIGRKWMRFTASQVSQPVFYATETIPFRVTTDLLVRCEGELSKLDGQSLGIVTVNTQQITNELIIEKQGWTMCGAGPSCDMDQSHSKEQALCIVCRKWFHEMCCHGQNQAVTYFMCNNCVNHAESAQEFKN